MHGITVLLKLTFSCLCPRALLEWLIGTNASLYVLESTQQGQTISEEMHDFSKFSCALGEVYLLSFKSQHRSPFDCFLGFQIVREVNVVSIDVIIMYSTCFNQQLKIWICAL